MQSNAKDASKGYGPYRRAIRSKRDTQIMKLGNPSISAESMKRVENIVDTLYDDLQEKGEKITYRTRNFVTITTPKVHLIRILNLKYF
jgi:23S rRNA maturation mini-RNase III